MRVTISSSTSDTISAYTSTLTSSSTSDTISSSTSTFANSSTSLLLKVLLSKLLVELKTFIPFFGNDAALFSYTPNQISSYTSVSTSNFNFSSYDTTRIILVLL